MRVLVISAAFPPMQVGGADYALRVGQHLAGRGVDVHVLTARRAALMTDPRITVHPIMRTWGWAELPRLLRCARRVRPDVIDIHFHGAWYNHHPMITFAATVLKRALPGIRIVTHIEWPRPVSPAGRALGVRASGKLALLWAGSDRSVWGFGTLLHESDCVIVLSDSHRVMLEDALPGISGKCLLIPPPPLMRLSSLDHSEARDLGRRQLGVTEDDYVLVYFGYVYRQRGMATLLDALALLAPSWPALRLVVIGAGLDGAAGVAYYESMRARASSLDLGDRIHWTGYYHTDSEDASLYLHAADTCVLPFEGGLHLNNSSFASAAVHGLPIVSTRADTVEPAFRDGGNVMLCPPGDAAALAAAIRALASDEALRGRLRAGALAAAREWFDWDTAMDRTMEAFGWSGISGTRSHSDVSIDPSCIR
ncbi:MAG: glycosyltransferase family 4 protein [Gemmatimonadota bacterium]